MCRAKPAKSDANELQSMHDSLLSALHSLLEEQRQTNQLLIMLVETLADEQDSGGQLQNAYLDGSPL